MLKFKEFTESKSLMEASIFGSKKPDWMGSFETGPKNHRSRPLGNWQSDNAWDIFAPAGTPVYSLTKGTVRKVKVSNKTSGKIFGTQVSVTSEDGNPDIFYTHLKNVNLKAGDKVNYGTKIGEVSEWDNNSKSTHVHVGLDKGVHIRTLLSQEGKILAGDLSGVENPEDGENAPENVQRFTDPTLDKEGDSRVTSFLQFLKNRRQSNLNQTEDSPQKAKAGIFTNLFNKNKVEEPIKGEVDITNLGGSKSQNAKAVINSLNKFGITNPLVQKAILSVIGKESGFQPQNEIPYTNTPNERIKSIFGKRVSHLTDGELTKLKEDPIKFWDVVYGGRYGNDKPGDGAKYLGRGFNGLTFKGNYEAYNDLLKKHGVNIDIVNNPDLVNRVDVAADINALYFLKNLSSKVSSSKYGNKDVNDFKDFDTALKAAVNANAGMGSNIEGSSALKKAEAFASKLDIKDLSNIA